MEVRRISQHDYFVEQLFLHLFEESLNELFAINSDCNSLLCVGHCALSLVLEDLERVSYLPLNGLITANLSGSERSEPQLYVQLVVDLDDVNVASEHNVDDFSILNVSFNLQVFPHMPVDDTVFIHV